MRDQAERFLLENRRLLERRLLSFYFEGGRREDVLTAFSAFQNTKRW